MSDARDALLAGGLEESTGGSEVHPVVRAKGRMIGFEAEFVPNDTNVPDGGGFYRTKHLLSELEVQEVREGMEFDFDSMDFIISASTKTNTFWGVWIASVAKVVGIDLAERDEDGELVWPKYGEIYNQFLDGKVVEIARTHVHKYRRTNKAGEWYDTEKTAYTLVSVEGATPKKGKKSVSALDAAISLVGTTSNLVEFITGIGADANISKDKALLTTIGSDPKGWLQSQTDKGLLEEADGWYAIA